MTRIMNNIFATLLVALLFLLILFTASNANAQVRCMAWEDFTQAIGEYQEVVVFRGVTSDRQQSLLVYFNPKTETWSVVVRKMPEDIVCLGGAGIEGALIAPAPAAKPMS